MVFFDLFFGYDFKVNIYMFDKVKVIQYFKQVWGGNVWKQGFILIVNYCVGSIILQIVMEIFKCNVESVNFKFKVKIQFEQWSEMFVVFKCGEEVMVLIGWFFDYVDLDNFFYIFYVFDGFYSFCSNFKDVSIDKWFNQVCVMVNIVECNCLYSFVGKCVYEQVFYILVFGGVSYIFFCSNFVGVMVNSYNFMIVGILGVFWKDLSKK